MSNTNYCKSIFACPLLCIFYLFLPVLIFSQIAAPIQTVTTRDYGDFTASITEIKTYNSEWAAYQNELENIDPPSGILYDRAIPISNIEQYDGTSNSPVATKAIHEQILLELQQAGLTIPESSSSQINYAAADLPQYDRVKLKLSVIGYDRKDPDDNYGSGTIEDETIVISASRIHCIKEM